MGNPIAWVNLFFRFRFRNPASMNKFDLIIHVSLATESSVLPIGRWFFCAHSEYFPNVWPHNPMHSVSASQSSEFPCRMNINQQFMYKFFRCLYAKAEKAPEGFRWILARKKNTASIYNYIVCCEHYRHNCWIILHSLRWLILNDNCTRSWHTGKELLLRNNGPSPGAAPRTIEHN